MKLANAASVFTAFVLLVRPFPYFMISKTDLLSLCTYTQMHVPRVVTRSMMLSELTVQAASQPMLAAQYQQTLHSMRVQRCHLCLPSEVPGQLNQ